MADQVDDTVKAARAEEQAMAKDRLDKVVNEYTDRMSDLQD